MAEKKGGAVATKETGGAVVNFDYGESAGAGFQNQTQEDILLPWLGVLQDLHDQTKEDKAEYIPGAKAGMIFNNVTENLSDGAKGVLFVPAVTQHEYVEWVPRKKGGGFVGTHAIGSEVVAKAKANATSFNELTTEAGNDLIETFYVYGAVVEEDNAVPICLAFTSSKIKVYRKWSTKVNMFQVNTPNGKVQPPMFAHLVRITTVKEQGTEGEYFNLVLRPANGTLRESLLSPEDERFLAAQAVGEMISEGSAKANHATQNTSGSADGGDGKEVPF